MRPGEQDNHAGPAWLETSPLAIDGVDIPLECYFLNDSEMVLGSLAPKSLARPAGPQKHL
jgi:hypothetical protein